MTNFKGDQLSLIADFDCEDSPVGDWTFDELGSDKLSIASKLSRLGSNYSEVSVIGYGELGSKMELDPNPISQSIPLGWLEQKPIKNGLYWYWRYYKISGARASIYLGKDYTKSVRKVLEKGYPSDAKPLSIPKPTANPQKADSQAENPLYRFPVADYSSFAA